MQVSRKLSRKILFQRLYAECFYKNNEDEFKISFFEWKFDFELDPAYIEEMYNIVKDKEGYLIEIIKKYAPKFDVKNMHLSYVLPIFIGASEMIYYTQEIPAKVSINEAIELAKTYWDDSSKKIVNGVLNKLYENFESLKKELSDIPQNTSFSLFAK